ncbi:MAG TPA: DUF4331 domain-containing protein [Bryobacteraceae bacterium]|nr:DUF4331 domain-containing protein [Bryobacteraceae bacterium]
MRMMRGHLAILLAMLMVSPNLSFGANHREAPITALDRSADITDWFAFVSYDDPSKVTFILNVDPLLSPANGPNYFPFDPEIVYAIKIDNDHDAVADVGFEVRFQTEIRAPGVFTGFIGVGNGVPSPPNAPRTLDPAGIPPTLIPPAITALDGKGSEGLSLRQTYNVWMVRGSGANASRTNITGPRKLIAVPSNVGARTMPDYPALARQGIYTLDNGMRVFAGTVDDPFYIDLGGVFDSLNLRGSFPSGTPGVLTPDQDGNDRQNFGPDYVAGYNVNTIAIEVPINQITQGGAVYPATDPRAVIGTWGTTSRPRISVRRSAQELAGYGEDFTAYRQVQRMGNPLINEVIIGTGSKDTFSMSDPKDDAQFANFVLDPLLARALNAVYGGLPVPDAPRTDLLLLAQYQAPIAPPGTPAGPVADLLRLNTGVPPTPAAGRKRLGAIAGDLGGFPNGRRVSDDVTDISLRAVAGILAGNTGAPYNTLGDGVNTNDLVYQETFPYVAWAQSGRPASTPAADAPSAEGK